LSIASSNQHTTINVSLAQPRPHLLFKYLSFLLQISTSVKVRRIECQDCTHPQDLCHHQEM
jgi:hypothetical protein